MNISSLSKYALAAVASASILAACSAGSQSGMGAAGTTMPSMKGGVANLAAQNGVLHAISGGHVISPDKKSKTSYAYVTDYGANVVDVYGYNTKTGMFGSSVGSTSSGISGPQGACSSKKGEVYIVNTNDSNILGFKAPSTTSNANISDPGYFPTGCSVSKKGDLAVSNICTAPYCSGGGAAVSIYKGAKGSPTLVSCSNLYRSYFDAYDSKGNIWVDGENSSYGFALCEIKAGASSGTPITLNVNPEFPGGVQVTKKYVTIVDQNTSTIYEYTISGTSGTEAGTVTLSGATDPVGDWIAKKFVLTANAGGGNVTSFKFPAGGAAVSTVSGISEPIGVTVTK